MDCRAEGWNPWRALAPHERLGHPMTQTERSRRRSVSPCFHPQEGLDLHVNLSKVDARELEGIRAVSGLCFRPEDEEEDLDLHVNLSKVDARELEGIRAIGCFRPEDEEEDLDLHVNLSKVDARELEGIRAIGCFRPEDE